MAKFIFDEDKVMLRDLVQSEQGRKPSETVALLARFVVTDDGQPVSFEEAREYVMNLSIPDGRRVMTEFWRFMGGVKDNAVPPPTGAA